MDTKPDYPQKSPEPRGTQPLGRSLAEQQEADEIFRHDATVNEGEIDDATGERNPNVPHSAFAPQDVDRARILTVAITIGAVVLIGFFVLMFITSALPSGEEQAGASSYEILQRKMDSAFGTHENADYNAYAVPQTAVEQEGQAQTPEQRLIDDMQREQQFRAQKEEMVEQQREAVPSVLPESPPAPVPLGGNNY